VPGDLKVSYSIPEIYTDEAVLENELNYLKSYFIFAEAISLVPPMESSTNLIPIEMLLYSMSNNNVRFYLKHPLLL
jgi:hypothetical protein